ncbi:MGDG synthase family glycosyltransferase [Gemella cuniculi]|uniref:MGDG synthase family glycosyltransferase n=1 Tax=Gemella cuniculi TaxID=150240 RepID=UPI0003FC6543|nr:glycosyltransferase [Gemella cuniculi]
MNRILLITGSFGNGHLQVSKSIKSMFEEKYKNKVEVIETDLFLQAHPNITPVLKKIYLYSFSYFRDIYGYVYYAGKNQINTSFYRYFSYNYLKKMISDVKPDVVVSTFPTPALSLLEKDSIPVVNVVTDYHFHKSWLTKGAIRYYVATDESKDAFINAGVLEENIKVFGLPIDKKFDEKIDGQKWLLENNLSQNKKTILLVAGAFGVLKNFDNIVDKLLENNNDVQIVIICGKNNDLKNKLEKIYENIKTVKVLGYTYNMREWMQSSTLLVTKAGGVTISESLASNIPLILFNPVPGQEKENAVYFEKNNMGKIAYTDNEVIESVKELFEDENSIKLMKESMIKNYQSGSSEKICDDIIKIINKY